MYRYVTVPRYGSAQNGKKLQNVALNKNFARKIPPGAMLSQLEESSGPSCAGGGGGVGGAKL